MKKRKLYRGFLCLVLVVVLALAGCGKKGPSKLNPTLSEENANGTDAGDTQNPETEGMTGEESLTGEESEEWNHEELTDETVEEGDETSKEDTSATDGKTDSDQTDTGKKDSDKKDTGKKDSGKTDTDKKDSDKKPTTPNGTPVATYGKLAVSGADLVDQNGNPVQLKGVSSFGIVWFPEFNNKKALQTMQDEWGIQIFRIAVYTEEYAGYTTKDAKGQQAQRDTVCQLVDWCTELGLYCIIDWHILNDNDPTTHKKEAKEFFKYMSEKYADNDNVFYEICNEPNGGTSWSTIKKYAEEVIGVIRENDEDGIVIVGTPTWSQDVDKAAKDPITKYDNIMYTLHFYADTHKDDLRKKCASAHKSGLPIFVTEYGICNASGSGNINEKEAAKWMQLLDDLGISSCIWQLSNKNETCSLIKTSKTSGWTTKDLSDSGKWFIKMMNGDLEKVGTTDYGSDDSGSGDSGSSGGGEWSGNPDNISGSGSGANCTADVSSSNTWNDGTNDYYQLNVSLKNTGSSDKANWKITVTFSGNVAIDQNWCCQCSVSGNTLTVTGADWNSSIGGNATIGDIGIIVYGKKLTITSITIQ